MLPSSRFRSTRPGFGGWLEAVTAGAVGVTREFRTRRNPFNALVNYFPTKDGRWVCLVFLQADRWWPDLCRHLDRPDLVDDPRFSTAACRNENVEECTRLLDQIFADRTLAEWRQVLGNLEGVWAPVLSPAEVGEDPQAIDNGYLPGVDKGDGRVYRGVASPARFDQESVGTLHGAPEHGENTDAILLELGFDWNEIIGFEGTQSSDVSAARVWQ